MSTTMVDHVTFPATNVSAPGATATVDTAVAAEEATEVVLVAAALAVAAVALSEVAPAEGAFSCTGGVADAVFCCTAAVFATTTGFGCTVDVVAEARELTRAVVSVSTFGTSATSAATAGADERDLSAVEGGTFSVVCEVFSVVSDSLSGADSFSGAEDWAATEPWPVVEAWSTAGTFSAAESAPSSPTPSRLSR